MIRFSRSAEPAQGARRTARPTSGALPTDAMAPMSPMSPMAPMAPGVPGAPGARPPAAAQPGAGLGSRALAAVIPPAEAAAAELTIDDPITGVGASLDFDALEEEWRHAGSLSEESYARLASAGIPRPVVDRYVEGQRAMGEALRAELLEPIGGEDGFARLADWARSTLSPADIDAYEAALQGTPEQAKLALRGLFAAYEDSVGKRPQLVGGRRDGEGSGVFGSAQAVADAIRDPRYKKDPAYRAEVATRLSRSNAFQRR